MVITADAFWAKVEIGDWLDCWPWTAGAASTGYGHVQWEGRQRPAHRVAYALLIGPVPDGLVLDHVKAWGCTNTLCCNPLHLEPVTQRENIARGERHRDWCPKGHPYSGANLRVSAKTGGRHCRTCDRASAARSNAAKSARLRRAESS